MIFLRAIFVTSHPHLHTNIHSLQLRYWLVVIALWIGIFVDIEANVSTSNDIQGTTTETAVYALAFLQGLRSLPSLLLWLKWGHYLWHRIRDGDMTHVKDLKSQSMAPHLNESLRNELVKYMQFGLNATPNVQVKNDCRYIRIKYKKVEKTIRGSFKADMETFENIEKTSRCTDCMCPFRKRYRRRKRTSVIRGKWVRFFALSLAHAHIFYTHRNSSLFRSWKP